MDVMDESAAGAVRESIRLARETHWDSLRSPHIFMGLLACPDPSVLNWGERLGADLAQLLSNFQELFNQNTSDEEPVLMLSREFLSDNVIRLLRDAYARAQENNRTRMTSMDLLITSLTTPNSVIAECFERNGQTAAKLTELAVIAEQNSHGAA